MDQSADKWIMHRTRHIAFYGYRWVAWVIAGIALALPGHASADLPRDAGLLLGLLAVNVAITAFGYPYVRFARQHGLILGVDLLASVLLLWLTGGNWLPFLPYALGSLVLPVLLFGSTGVALGATAFMALDQLSRTLIYAGSADQPFADPLSMVLRLLTPFAFAIAVLVALQIWQQRQQDRNEQAKPQTSAFVPQRGDSANQIAPPLRFSEPPADRRTPPRPTSELLDTPPLALARTVPAPRFDPIRQMLYDLTPTTATTLAETIDTLAVGVSKQSGIQIRTLIVGTPQPISAAYHMVLLRTAQEALLNVQQHAQAHNVLITLTFIAQAVTLVIQDDGVGLLDGTYERPGLHALRAVRYRLSELDGQLIVTEADHGGVLVRATLPLP